VARAFKGKRPTHYKNLIDSDYIQLGTSMMSGLYNDIPTAYAVAHFGAPTEAAVPAFSQAALDKKVFVAAAKPLTATATPAVLGTIQKTVTPVPPAPVKLPTPVAFARSKLDYSPEHSGVAWKEVAGGIEVHITAAVTGSVKEARVVFSDSTVLLAPTDAVGVYAASHLLHVSKQELFKVIVFPTIEVVATDGEKLSDTIAWQNPPVISPTPLERYMAAERSVPLAASLFTFSRGLYIGFLILFTLSFISLIAIEVRKQHPHIIVQTLGLMGLLVVLILM
jgi:hypothetical protein